MVRSRGEARKLARWPRADRAQQLRLPAELRGEDRPRKPDVPLSRAQCLQQPRARPRTARQIDSLQLPWKFPLSQIPAARAGSRKLALPSRAEISRQSSDPKRKCVRLMADA